MVRNISYQKHLYCSDACPINLGSSVILTAGGESNLGETRVTEYNETGHVRDLPPIQESRQAHSCSFYENDEGIKVEIDINNCSIMIFQTYLVSGGRSGRKTLSSTELLVETASAWVYTGELPHPLRGLRGANIDNKVLLTGKWYLSVRRIIKYL